MNNQHQAKSEIDFPGISIRESKLLKWGMGVCLPPFGIFVYEGASIAVKQHEFGHFLQYQEMGFLKFYLFVGIPSLWSAALFPKLHHQRSFEKNANERSRAFFGVYSVLL